MWPQILGGLISAAGSLAGGRQSQKSNEAMARQQAQLQKEFAQHGIRWKVEDAKAAGLHPLYALGASTTPYSPVGVMDSKGPALAEASQHVGRAIAATSTSAEKQMAALAIEEAKSRIGETDARRDYYLSEAARNAQQISPGLPHEASHNTFGTADGSPATPSPEFAKAIIPRQGDAAIAEGPTPLWREFTLAGDLPIVLPGGMQGDAAEVLESLSESWPMMWTVYKENVHRYGQSWGDEFLKRYSPIPQFEILPPRSRPKTESRRGRYRDHKKFRDNFVPPSLY